MGEKATVTATRLVLLCSKAIEEYREALREQEYDETGPLTIIPSDFEIARDVVVEFFEGRRKTPEPEKNSGNAAAMREALQQCGRALEKAQCSSAFQAANTGASYVAAALSSAHAALSAHARNCDWFATAADALAAYTKERDLTLSPEAQAFIWWLFEKGGAE